MRACIVQFPHPGGEHVPPGENMAWNMGRHRRKFLVSSATIVNPAGRAEEATDVVFWGEWEAPSRVVARWRHQDGYPTVLHQPYLSQPPGAGFRQNTDPWVFGDTFIYSNCKQLHPTKTPSALQRLPVASVVLFGSVRGDQFVLDTVFVVGAIVGSFTPLDPHDLPVSDPFRICTLDSLTTCEPEVAQATFTLYRGATPTDPVDGMFSFVPSLPRRGDGPRFPRPPIELPGVVNPKSRQSPSGAKLLRPRKDVTQAWSSVVDQVIDAGLHLATNLPVPPKH